jgi:hypothetical protein
MDVMEVIKCLLIHILLKMVFKLKPLILMYQEIPVKLLLVLMMLHKLPSKILEDLW